MESYWKRYDKIMIWYMSQVWHVLLFTMGLMIAYIISNQFFNNELWPMGFLAIFIVGAYAFIMMGILFVGGAYCLLKDVCKNLEDG